MKELKFNSPKRTSEILASSFWWNRIIHIWDVGFPKSKAVEFHGLGWVSMSNVWVAFVQRENRWKICAIPRKGVGIWENHYQVGRGGGGGGYWEGEKIVAKKEIGLVCWKIIRCSHLWFVVLHLPLNLNATMMFNTFTSCKTLSYILWAPSQGPWISLMLKCRKEWTTIIGKVEYQW